MSNIAKYRTIFQESFQCDEVERLEYQAVPAWDSVGHMQLIAALEDAFAVELDVDDIIDLSSYKKGLEILSRYNVKFIDG